MKTVAGVCVVIAFCAATACIATKQTYLSRGNKLYDAGKYAEASLNYLKAIQKDPQFGEAYYRLGLASIKQNDVNQAYDSLFRAVQLLPNNVDALEKFADVSLAAYLANPSHPQFLYKQISQLSIELLAKNANSYEGLILKAYLASTDRKPKEAIVSFRKALQINSSDAGVRTSLVQALLVDGQTQEAEKAANDLMYREKTSYGKIYDLMYGVYFEHGRLADAENVLKAKVSNNPKQADGIIQLARHYNRVQKPVEMKAALQQLLDNPKDFSDARLWVGDFYIGIGDYPDAIHYFEEGTRAHPQRGKERSVYQNRTVLALLAERKNTEASALVDRILAENPQDDDAKRIRADIWLDSNKNLDDALRIFKDLSSRNPKDAVLRLHLGRAYWRTGDPEAARLQFLEAIKIRTNFIEPRYELVDIDLKSRPAEAQTMADEILSIRPDDRLGKLLHARVMMVSGEKTKARTELAQFIKDTPKDPDAQLQLGLLAIDERKFPEAIVILDRLRAAGEPRAYPALANTYAAQRQFDKALEVLNEGLKKWPDAPPLLDQSGMIEALAGNYNVAIVRFQRLISINPKSAQARRRFGEVYDLKGDRNNAVSMYQQASDLAPGNVEIAMTLADALARAGQIKEAKIKYQGIIKAHPDNASAMNDLAYLLADSGGDLDEALRLAQGALKKIPGEPGFSDTVGYIYLKKGQKDSAMRTFGNLVHSYPHYVPFRYHLGLTLYEKGDKAGAKKELQAALADHPSFDDEQRIKALLTKIG